MAAAAKLLQSCPTLCDPMDSSPPGFSVHRILQARILEWVAISFSRSAFYRSWSWPWKWHWGFCEEAKKFWLVLLIIYNILLISTEICHIAEEFGGGNGNPLQYSCLENPVDRGAWWAPVHSVAQTQTWLKRLSMYACTEEGNGDPLQYPCLENPTDRGAWGATVHGIREESDTTEWLNNDK